MPLRTNTSCAPARLSRSAAVLSLVALGTLAAPALAQERAFYVGARQAIVHDSNLFRESTNRTSDWRSETGLLGGLEHRFGLQRVYGDAYVQANRFDDTKRLNHTSYGALVGLDWSGYERISGTVQLGYDRSLADYGTAGTTFTTDRNLETARFARATARYALTQRLAMEGGLERREVSFSSAAGRSGNLDEDVAELGFIYGYSGVLTLGVGYRYTSGEAPFFSQPTPGNFVADEIRRRDLAFTAVWVPSAISTINARIAYSRQRNSQATNAEFSGTTGSLEWVYTPSGRLQLTTSVARETGSERRFADFSVTDPIAPTQLNTLTTTYSIGAEYELTGRTNLTAGARRSSGSFDDRTTEYTLGATYDATRTVDVGCNLRRLKQSGPLSYSANVVGCYAQILLP